MQRSALTLSLSLTLTPLALAGHDGDSTIWVTNLHDAIDTAWVISFPTFSSDYFSNAHAVVAGSGDSEHVADGLPITGISVSVADFYSSLTYPMVVVFYSNLTIDPSGVTPDLSQPIGSLSNPALPSTQAFEFVPFDLPANKIATGTQTVNTVVQLPPGDSGLLGVGADESSSATDLSAYTQDGFTSPAIVFTILDLGLNPGQDNTTTTSCNPANRLPHGRLRVSGLPSTEVGAGDHLTTTAVAGRPIMPSFFGNQSGDQLRLVATASHCGPGVALGPVLSALPDADGDGSHLRLTADWPFGYGSTTFQFTALWGNSSCPVPGVGFTNCVTVV